MTWVLVITALVNGQVIHADKVRYPTKEACMEVLKQAEQHPMFKAYNAKGACEKQ
jgi:hypothetical protein